MKTPFKSSYLLSFPIVLLSSSAWHTTPSTPVRPRTSLYDTLLAPEENPDLDLGRTSAGGVSYRAVFDRLQQLYPREALDERTASSRSDGYWPYLQTGRDP